MTIFLENTYGNVAVLKEYRTPGWFYSHITLFCRILGPLVMIAMWALAITAFAGIIYPVSGIYLLFLALLLIFQEFSWIFSKMSFLQRENCIGMCWRGFIWVDSWKRAAEYLLLAILGFVIGGFSAWPLFVGGALILILSIAYFLKAIRFRRIEPLKPAGEAIGGTPGFTGIASAPPPTPTPDWGNAKY